jgi:CRISPR/Cas system-associated exonuclease Cas4 (RecB family)
MSLFVNGESLYPPNTTGNRGVAETQHILNALELKARGGRRNRPYAGSVGYCPRENWFHANSENSVGYVTAPLNLYQGIGNGVEERIIKGLTEHNLLLGSQVRLPNPPKSFGIDVGGFIDAIALDSQGRPAAYEVKTTGTMPTSPKPKHLAQAMVYSVLGGIDRVYLLYVGRKVQDFPDPTPLVKVFQIDTSSLLREYAIRIVLASHSLSSKEAPPRPATFRKSSECMFCDFQAKCWNDDGFATMSTRAYSERTAEAEKTADELLVLRPTFYKELLLNCSASFPVNMKDKFDEALEQAKKLEVAALRNTK